MLSIKKGIHINGCSNDHPTKTKIMQHIVENMNSAREYVFGGGGVLGFP